jgi:predicted ribosomally synthesized peptide with nif11-like leader
MNNQVKEFLKKASEDDVLSKKMEALSGVKDREEVRRKAAEIAKEAGFEISPEDFETDEKMDDAEVADITGGWSICACVTGGGGKEDADGTTCACLEAGFGLRKDNGNQRCMCVFYGFGKDSNLADCGGEGTSF